jgi:hypothetical protein
VYRSTDGGDTWSYLGLHDTRAIGRIVLDPSDPNVAYVPAAGDLWTSRAMAARVVYRRPCGATMGRFTETDGRSRPRRDGSFAKDQGAAITKSSGSSRDARTFSGLEWRRRSRS